MPAASLATLLLASATLLGSSELIVLATLLTAAVASELSALMRTLILLSAIFYISPPASLNSRIKSASACRFSASVGGYRISINFFGSIGSASCVFMMLDIQKDRFLSCSFCLRSYPLTSFLYSIGWSRINSHGFSSNTLYAISSAFRTHKEKERALWPPSSFLLVRPRFR